MPVYSSSGKTKQFQSNPGAPNSDSSRSKTNTVDPDAPDANNSQSKTAEVNPDAPLAESGKTKQFQSNPGAPNSDSSQSKTNTVDPDAPDANNSQSKTAEVNPDAPLAESGASCSRSANNPGGGPVTQTWIAPGPTAAILSAQNNLGSPLVAGTPITRLPGNTVTTAFAGTGMPTRRADGLVLQFANSGDSVRYVYQGPLVLPDWTVLTGTMLLIPGATYYLGMTPGTLTTTMPTRPSFALLQVVGVALDANTLDVDPDTYEVDL